jgi:hypothetical protein
MKLTKATGIKVARPLRLQFTILCMLRAQGGPNTSSASKSSNPENHMNKTATLLLASLAAFAASAMAVPSGINYQGALTDDQGNPITGTRTMSIKLFGAATGGAQLYTEEIGAVDVSDGVFSFEFGTSGTSNAEQSDTVALTDGTATTFQKVVSAAEVVAGSVSVSDGTYTWSQSGGSSNDDDFGVVYSTNLRRVTVTYFNGAPTAGRTITATYRTPASGISGALAGDNQPWAEITVDGVAQVPRQKVLAVPFAATAAKALALERAEATTMLPIARFGRDVSQNYNGYDSPPGSTTSTYVLPAYIESIRKLSFSYGLSKTGNTTGEQSSILIKIEEIDPVALSTSVVYSHEDRIVSPATGSFEKSLQTMPLSLNHSAKYYVVSVTIGTVGFAKFGANNGGVFHWMKIDH